MNRTGIREGQTSTSPWGSFDEQPREEDWGRVLGALGTAYERGWQPADVLHVLRRAVATTEAASVAGVILREADRSGAWARAPLAWTDQVRAVADAHPRAETAPPPPQGVSYLLRHLGSRPRLCPPPSEWPGCRDASTVVAATGSDPKVLNKIRGLLAKAESTEFTEEAETLTAKAQELMTRYAITSALLESARGTSGVVVHSRRIHLDAPYAKQKALLLTTVGNANHVCTLYNSRDSIATAVGTPVDLEQAEMLFTSLLVQATRAMQSEGRKGSTSTPFRKAFLFGFAVRIGQRLTEADKAATAQAVTDSEVAYGDLLPVLARRSEAVKTEVARLFGRTKSVGWSVSDGDGWRAGQAAADAAALAADGRSITG